MTDERETPRHTIGRPRAFSDLEVFVATARAIQKNGYAKLAVNTVSSELGCTPPALLSRYGSKSGLLRAYLKWTIEISEDAFRVARKNHNSPLTALRERYRTAESSMSNEFAGNPLRHTKATAFHVAAWNDPDLHDLEAERRKAQLQSTIALLDAAVEKGELVDCDTQVLGRTMVAAIAGTALQLVADPNPDAGEQLVNVINELVRPYLVTERTPR